MAAAAPSSKVETGFELLSLNLISESPHNPRKAFDPEAMAELVESVRAKGVVIPVLVRPAKEGGYELVYGHRRFRAARTAGLSTIPATVRELGDLDALEIAILENCTRADIHPLEEGAAYRKLHDDHGLTIEEIGAKVGKGKSTVVGRMKLCTLEAKARDALLSGQISASVALLLARIPSADLQEEALKKLLEQQRWHGQVSFKVASDLIQRDFMLRLTDAPFDPKDEQLVPKAGACGACPKRTGAQPELFGDAGPNLCTDPLCFKHKAAVHVEREKEAARVAGREVLEGKRAQDALVTNKYVRLDEKCFSDPKHRTYGELLKKADVERAVVVDVRGSGEGRVREVVPMVDALHALKEIGKSELAKAIAPVVTSAHGHDQKRQKDLKRRREVVRLALPILLDTAGENPASEDRFWRCLIDGTLTEIWRETMAAVASRRGIETKEPEKALKKLAAGLEGAPLQCLLLELLIAGDAAGSNYGAGYGEVFRRAAGLYQVDLKKLERQVAAEEKAKKRPAKKAGGAR